MIDTGAEYSVLPELLQKKASKSVVIKSATGQSAKRSFLQPLECQIGGHRLTHQFLYIPECPIPLLGRDMLSKLQAQITFTPRGPEMKLPSKAAGIISLSVPKEQSWRLMSALQVQPTLDTELNKLLRTLQVPPGVWAENSPPGMAKNIAPIVVTLKPMATPVSVKQYPLPRRAAEGIQKHLDRLLKYGLLKPCQSEWNTPLLPVRKPGTDEYRPVQDLRLVNQAIETLHPNVPNPYTLLSLIPPEATFFTVLDLKDAFFCCRLAPQSQPIFAFQWEDPLTGTKGQLTWTRLPQGFKNSPTLFGTALAKDLTSYPSIPGEKVVLQYVDDLILAAKDFDTCKEGTEELLHLLWQAGYRVSQKKAQLCLEKVKYLGFDISHQQRALRPERKEAICLIKEPTTRKQLRGFLGTAGFCRLWIPDFSSLAKPLHESTRGAEKDPFVWGPEQQQAFLVIKQRLMEAPALGLPNSEKPFQLYVHEQNGIAAAVLTQRLGSWNRPVAYLSKQLDSVAKGWPPCLRAVAATASLVKEADKFTFGQTMYVNVPHAVLTLMEYKGSYWLTNPRMARYQGLLCENPRIHLRVVNMLNPATLLPLPEVDDEESHDCLQIMDEVYSSRPDLKDEPLKNPDVVYYTDGSSYLHEGARRAGYAVVTNEEVVEAEALPAGTSAQKAELIGLTRALQLAAGCKANIYTDSKYAFLTLHAHGALWKERGLIGAHGKALKYGPEVEILLEAVWAPEQIAVMHCKGHGRGRDPITRGNRAADKAAREAAQKPVGGFIAALIPEVVPEEVKPHYTPEERKWAEQEGAVVKDGWMILPDNRIYVPHHLAGTIVRNYHESTHLGGTATRESLSRKLYIINLSQLATCISQKCVLCAKNNPRQGPVQPPGIQHVGYVPMESLIVDFTELVPSKGFKYLLVFVDTLTGWVEAFPTRTEKAREVTKRLLTELIPRFGLPRCIGSDNGPAFIDQVVQEVCRVLQVKWRLHAAYRPQSSGKTERMNRTLKTQLAKLTQETGLGWVDVLPITLFRVRCAPTKRLKLSPFELLYGRPPSFVQNIPADLKQIGDHVTQGQVQSLSRVFVSLNRWVLERTPCSIAEPIHQFQAGDSVWVKEWKRDPLAPKWRGPYTVLLSTPTAVKVAEVTPWIHHSRLKKSEGSWTCKGDPSNPLKLTLSKNPCI
uniref:Gag-Pol polyprotein n=1 Tax=Podarcis muralis TaxID=64176 RepID=A0A670ILY5_PODMU